jgi:deoxycytidylate deaminase
MNALMNAGNQARTLADADDVLAVMAVNDIAAERSEGRPLERVAHLIRSLKTPHEVRLLREVYRPGFFLIGVAGDDSEQHKFLTEVKGLTDDEAQKVTQRDQDEGQAHGQRTRDTFYLADVFIELTGERYKKQLERFLELVFGHPFRTPTRAEHAMFMAYASAARSAQLGRQVGASITTAEGEVLAVGFNEVPSPTGGSYWEGDDGDARDHNYDGKVDSNQIHRSRIVDSIASKIQGLVLTKSNVDPLLQQLSVGRTISVTELNSALQLTTDTEIKAAILSSELRDITEYGRAVHAEMDALLTCARLGTSVRGKHLFTTTFPCHNCTRHIIAAGVARVTYIEPYPKSRAAVLHSDGICFDVGEAKRTGKIPFLPFVGVGPRRYLDLFSSDLSTGTPFERRDDQGRAIFPERAGRPPRIPMLPLSYLDRETKLLHENQSVINRLQGEGS